MKATITNDFHGTAANVIVPWHGRLSDSQVQTIRHRLCGIKGCECGEGALKQRGQQNVYIVQLSLGEILIQRYPEGETGI